MPGSERFQNKNSHHAIRRTTCVRWENETCFASGHPSRHLFLHGVQFTGKFVVRKQDVSGRRLLERQVYYAPSRPDEILSAMSWHPLPRRRTFGPDYDSTSRYFNSISTSLELSRSCLPSVLVSAA